MAIINDDADAMCNIGYLYDDIEKNHESAKKYYLMAIDNGDSDALYNLKLITTPLERYVLFTENNIKFDDKITRDMHIYTNKKNKFMKICKCPVCLEDKESIPLECTHYVCSDCYTKFYNTSCPVCRL